MAADVTLLLDVGGQGSRALLIDADARVRFEADRDVATSEHDERVEHDAEAAVSALAALIADVDAACADGGMRIGAAGLAVQRGSIACWDRETGAALSPVISWRDRRALPGMQALADDATEIKRRTGLRFSPYGGAPKLQWCLSQLDAVRAAADEGCLAFGPLGSFLAARVLQGQPFLVEDTLAQRTLLWSRERFDWDPWLLERFGLPATALPPVAESRGSHGALLGVKGAPQLELLIGDQNAVPFLDGEPDPDTLYVNIGTGAFLLRPVPAPVDTPVFQLSLLDRESGGRWAIEASVHGAASAIEWLSRHTGEAIDRARFVGLRERVFDPPLFLNTIDGLGSPWWRSGPRPAFVGEDVAHEGEGDAHVSEDDARRHGLDARLLAVLESIAFLVRANVDAMRELVAPPRRVVVCGGLSRADIVCQLIGSVLEADVLRLRDGEGTALGAWCMVQRRRVPEDRYEAISARSDSALIARYARWLQCLEQDAG